MPSANLSKINVWGWQLAAKRDICNKGVNSFANATFSSGNTFAFEPKPGMHVSMNVCVVSVCHYWLLRVIDLLFDACLHLFSL